MTTTSEPTEAREVSPLELFFYDLVFVFAVSQLPEHLPHDLTWRGAAETCRPLGTQAQRAGTHDIDVSLPP